MPDYYEQQVALEQKVRAQERIDARAVIISRAPEDARQDLLDALGLLEP